MRTNLFYALIACLSIGVSCKTSKNNLEKEEQEYTMKEDSKTKAQSYTLFNTKWNLVTLRGLDVMAEESLSNQPFLDLKQEDNFVFGSNSCNTFRGSFDVDTERQSLRFGNLATTKRACPDMRVSHMFMELLSMVDNYSIQGNTLQLSKAKMAPLAIFKAEASNSNELIMWVNDHKVDCEGEGKQKCLQVKYGDDQNGDWENFYSGIKGFQYEPGYVYKLSVNQTERTAAVTPQGASTYQYALNRVIEKKSSTQFGIHDIWALTALQGQDYRAESSAAHPRMEINVTEKFVYGTDGCNNFQGQILKINDEELKIEPLMSTLKLCRDMEIPNQFNQLIEKVIRYKKNETTLDLMDEEGSVILSFKKVD